MKFRATDDQVAQICANAVNASHPVGMGILHYVPGDKPKEEFKDFVERGDIYLDYYQGRCTKLKLKRVEKDLWEIRAATDPDYQTWAKVYPTTRDLITSAGGIREDDSGTT